MLVTAGRISSYFTVSTVVGKKNKYLIVCVQSVRDNFIVI